MTASCAAQLTAASDAGDPSTPTMIPKSFVVEDILISFRQGRRYAEPHRPS
jgi:hypothetical protein